MSINLLLTLLIFISNVLSTFVDEMVESKRRGRNTISETQNKISYFSIYLNVYKVLYRHQ